MHTSLPAWLALSSAILPTVTAFYPYHYGSDSTRSRRTSKPSSDINVPSLTLPLRRVPTGLRTRQNAYDILNSNNPSQDNSVAIDQDGADLSYMVAVTFGDSKEEYHMLLDSAASNTWVMGQDCTSAACKTHSTFGKGDSSTLKTNTETFSVTYGTGSSSGTLATDTLHIGSLSPTLTFGLANNVSEEFRSYPMDGILGIGRGSSTSNEISAPQIMDVLSNNKLIGAKIYGIHLSRASNGVLDGELNLGKVNEERFDGEMNYIDCVDNDTGFWEIPLENAGVNGDEIRLSAGGSGKRTAIMDTGTSFILMPRSDAEAIHAPIQGASQDGETFFVPCDSDAVVQFGFHGKKYNISTADWIGAETSEKGKCRSNIIGRKTFSDSQWLVGDTFLKNVYSVFDFDKSRVGLGVKGGEEEEVDASSASASASTATGATSSASPSASRTASSASGTETADPTSAAESQAQDEEGNAGARASASLLLSLVAVATTSLFI